MTSALMLFVLILAATYTGNLMATLAGETFNIQITFQKQKENSKQKGNWGFK